MTEIETEVVLDVETTGRSAGTDRIIEVCAIKIQGTAEVGEPYHQMFNPEREVEAGAEAIHGWNWDKLKGFPRFRAHARDLAAYVGQHPIVAHNGSFDMRFLKAEFAAAGMHDVVLGPLRDTLPIARRRFPSQKNDLDSLCTRLGVDRSGRDLHGAFIDVRLLIQVYVKLLGRDQLIPVHGEAAIEIAEAVEEIRVPSAFGGRVPRPAPPPSEEEIARHVAFVEKLGDKAKGILPLWLRG